MIEMKLFEMNLLPLKYQILYLFENHLAQRKIRIRRIHGDYDWPNESFAKYD